MCTICLIKQNFSYSQQNMFFSENTSSYKNMKLFITATKRVSTPKNMLFPCQQHAAQTIALPTIFFPCIYCHQFVPHENFHEYNKKHVLTRKNHCNNTNTQSHIIWTHKPLCFHSSSSLSHTMINFLRYTGGSCRSMPLKSTNQHYGSLRLCSTCHTKTWKSSSA